MVFRLVSRPISVGMEPVNSNVEVSLSTDKEVKLVSKPISVGNRVLDVIMGTRSVIDLHVHAQHNQESEEAYVLCCYYLSLRDEDYPAAPLERVVYATSRMSTLGN